MALDTYANLQTAIATWLHRADLTSSIPDFITLAEASIFRRLRTRDMETSFTGTIDATANTLALPTSYLSLKYAYVSSTPMQWLERKAARWVREKYPFNANTGVPVFVAREGSNFIFGPFTNSAYTVNGVYYKNVGPLSTSAHAVFTANPDCYLYGALLEAAPYLKDDARTGLWQARYDQAMVSAQLQSDKEESSGSPLAMVAS